MTNTTGDFRVLKKESRVVPHYLKPSEGSCHDNCKNGYKPVEPEKKLPLRRKLLGRSHSTDKEGKNSTVDVTILARHGERQGLPHETRSPRKKVEDSKSSTTSTDKHQFVKKVGSRPTKMKSMSSNNLLPTIIDKDDDQITKPRFANSRRMSEVIVRKETTRRLIDAVERRKTILVSPNAQHSSSRPSSAKGGLSKTVRKANLCNSNRETRHNQPRIPEIASPILDEPKAEAFNEVSSSQLLRSISDDNAILSITTNERTRNQLEENVEMHACMKFKRGTIIDVENENNGPWRLNFNQGTIISQLGDVDKEEIELREVVPIETTRGDLEDSEKINLKHVDELEKDNPSSLDNMIEEAASKIARLRKDKVKAMVSAFETVMSIQDTKSLARKRSL